MIQLDDLVVHYSGAGANAVGILEEDFARIPELYRALARVLQFGVAYNAFSLVRNRIVKDRKWCLIEPSGVVAMHFGARHRWTDTTFARSRVQSWRRAWQ